MPDIQSRMIWLRERVIPVMSLVMAVFTITMAFFTVSRSLDSGRQLKAISENLTTQFVGEFPAFLPRLTSVINEAQPGEEITVICDFPGYGIYSNHKAFLDYRHAVEVKNHESKITMMVLTDNEQQNVLRAQFANRTLEEIKVTPQFKEFLVWSHHSEADIESKEAFFAVLEATQKEVWSNFKFVNERRQRQQSMPMFLWIVGERVAMFSIPHLLGKGGTLEAAFLTRDQALIKQLRVVAESYRETSLLVP